MNLPNWLVGLIDLFGRDDYRVARASKHNRAKTKPRHWKQHRKIMRTMASESRRINRGRQ